VLTEIKKLHLLLLVDDEDSKRTNFKHDRLGPGMKKTFIITKIAQMYVLELQNFSPNIVEKMVAPLEETSSQEPMKTPESFVSPLSGQFVNGFPDLTSQGEIQTSDVMQMPTSQGEIQTLDVMQMPTAQGEIQTSNVMQMPTSQGEIQTSDVMQMPTSQGEIQTSNVMQMPTSQGEIQTSDVMQMPTSQGEIQTSDVMQMPTSQGEIQTSDVMQMLEGDALVHKKRRATIISQVRSPTTSHNTRAHQKLTPRRKSKHVQKQLN
jgi:hypothetical protein